MADDDFSQMTFEEPPDFHEFVAGAVPGLEEPNFHKNEELEPEFLQKKETTMTDEERQKTIEMQRMVDERLRSMGLDPVTMAAVQNAAVAAPAAKAAAAAGAAAITGKPDNTQKLTDFVKKPLFQLPADSSNGETIDSVEKAFSDFTQESLSLKYLALTQSWMQKFNIRTTDAAFGQFMSLIYVMNFLDKYPEKIALVLEKSKQETVDFVRAEAIKQVQFELEPKLYTGLIQRAEKNVSGATKFITGGWILFYLLLGGFLGNSFQMLKITRNFWAYFL